LEERREKEKSALGSMSPDTGKDAKAAKGATPADEEKTPEFEPAPHHFENQILVAGEFTDVKEKLKSLADITYDSPESTYYI